MSDEHKSNPEWLRQQSIWFDPPGETASQWLLARLKAIRRMYEIETEAAV